MSRRKRRWHGGTTTQLTGLERQVRTLGLYTWVEADNYTVDGVSGKVASFPDKVNSGTGIRAITAAHALVQSTSAVQCIVPTSDAAFRNARVASFAAAQYYTSNAPGSAWNFLRRESHEHWVVLRLDTGVAGPTKLFTTGAGTVSGADTDVSPSSFAGTTRSTTLAGTSRMSAAIGTYTAAAFRIHTRVSAAAAYVNSLNGATATSGSLASADDAGNNSAALTIGATAAGASPITGQVAAFLAVNRALTVAERNVVESYLLVKYGV